MCFLRLAAPEKQFTSEISVTVIERLRTQRVAPELSHVGRGLNVDRTPLQTSLSFR